jgi:hypothetical protein
VSYSLFWRSPALPYTQKATAISVPAGATISNAASIRFTGKGAANYGKVQQENLMRLLESFAGASEPNNATVGQLWYDTSAVALKVCTDTSPVTVSPTWRALNSVVTTDVGIPSPSPARLGDLWFQRTGSVSGVLHVFDGLGRYGSTGGWEQIWPTPAVAGGRPEYDTIFALVMSLIGDPAIYTGGNGAVGRSIANLTSMGTLDTAKQANWTAALPADSNIVTGTASSTLLKAQPNANDWDTLLAAAKYALNRLELPASFVDDVSPVPFVYDGRPAPATLVALGSSDVRYPSTDRLVGTQFGSISLMRFYQETYNVLSSATSNKFLLKGILGTSGTNPTFNPSVSASAQASFTANINGSIFSPTTVSHGLIFNFASAAEMARFFYAGQAIEILLTHVPSGSPTTSDLALLALTSARGRIRVLQDQTLVMTPAASTSLAEAPWPNGYAAFTAPGVLLAQLDGGPNCACSVSGRTNTSTSFGINFGFYTTGPTTGNFTVTWNVINDSETYPDPTPTRVFPLPIPFNLADKQGDGIFV